MTYVEVRDKRTGKVVCHYDPVRDIVEVVRRNGEKARACLTEHRGNQRTANLTESNPQQSSN